MTEIQLHISRTLNNLHDTKCLSGSTYSENQMFTVLLGAMF